MEIVESNLGGAPSRSRAAVWTVVLNALLAGAVGLSLYHGHVVVFRSVAAGAGLLVLWQLFLRLAGRFQPHAILNVKRPHYVQALVQLAHYVYWGLYWDFVWVYFPLIIVQIIFAYAVETLLAWSRKRPYPIGFGPFPIILSLNLFPWFREEVFYLQLIEVAFVFAAKEFIRWNRDGRSTHIFNPSGFALAVALTLLMLTGSVELTYAVDLTTSFYLPPNFYEVMFLLTIPIQFLFSTTLVSFGAALALCLLFVVSEWILGTPVAVTPIDLVVFLGINFLVTDPATSPSTKAGKFLFGFSYGVGILVFFVLLRHLIQPSFYDKILMVPVVNLMVPLLDRAGKAIERWAAAHAKPLFFKRDRYAHVGLYVLLFLAILPRIKDVPEYYDDPLPPKYGRQSPRLRFLTEMHTLVQDLRPEAIKPFGFAAEPGYYRLAHSTEIAQAMLYFNEGRRLAAEQRFDQAVAETEKAVRLVPRFAQAHNNLGAALGALGRFVKATMHLREAVRLDSRSAESHNNLARALEAQGLVEEAAFHRGEAVRLRPAPALLPG